MRSGSFRRAIFAALLITGLTTIAPLAAQDTPTPEPPTSTPDVPTPEPPMQTNTPPPTATLPDVPTLTPTLTETLTETPTETATATATPSLTLAAPASQTPSPFPSSTDLPPATATATATGNLFPTPTFLQSSTATVSPTASVSLTATGSETTSPTFTHTPTPTASATLPPEPPLTLLFEDTFDLGPLPVWQFGAGWSVVPSEGGQALQALDTGAPVTLTYGTLGDVAVELRAQFSTGAIRLTTRENATVGYTVTLDANGNVLLTRAGQPFGTATVLPVPPGTWRTLRLSTIGEQVRVSVDGAEVIALTYSIRIPPGGVSFAYLPPTAEPAGNLLLVDNVRVWLALDALPTPTLTPTGAWSELDTLSVETGREIAYMDSASFAQSTVRILDENGDELTSQLGGFPEWSITGDELAFLSRVPDIQIYNLESDVVRSVGTTTTLILPRINGTYWDPVYSPNGSQVAFVWSRSTDRVDLYVMNVDGTNVRNLTVNLTDTIHFLPAWSPDGQRIAFTSTNNEATRYSVRMVSATGGTPVDVAITNTTDPTASYAFPFWSGNGNYLAFWSVANPVAPQFKMVTISGSTVGSITNFDASVSPDWGRVWIPEGTQYAYMSSFNATSNTFQLLYSANTGVIGTGWFPKWRPTNVDWTIAIDPSQIVPPVTFNTSVTCPLRIRDTYTQGVACALNVLRDFGSLTWEELISVILYAEGGTLLAGGSAESRCVNNTFPGIPGYFVPPTPIPPTPAPPLVPVPFNFVPGTSEAPQCNVVQREYVYAVVQQMFNLCDDEAGVNPGQCTQAGLLNYLGGVQRWREGRVSREDVSQFLTLARNEITYFTNGTSDPDVDRVFGRCPCTTGNVATVQQAQEGQLRSNDPGYAAYAPTGNSQGRWFSYSYYDNMGQADTDYRYLKIY